MDQYNTTQHNNNICKNNYKQTNLGWFGRNCSITINTHIRRLHISHSDRQGSEFGWVPSIILFIQITYQAELQSLKICHWLLLGAIAVIKESSSKKIPIKHAYLYLSIYYVWIFFPLQWRCRTDHSLFYWSKESRSREVLLPNTVRRFKVHPIDVVKLDSGRDLGIRHNLLGFPSPF